MNGRFLKQGGCGGVGGGSGGFVLCVAPFVIYSQTERDRWIPSAGATPPLQIKEIEAPKAEPTSVLKTQRGGLLETPPNCGFVPSLPATDLNTTNTKCSSEKPTMDNNDKQSHPLQFYLYIKSLSQLIFVYRPYSSTEKITII